MSTAHAATAKMVPTTPSGLVRRGPAHTPALSALRAGVPCRARALLENPSMGEPGSTYEYSPSEELESMMSTRVSSKETPPWYRRPEDAAGGGRLSTVPDGRAAGSP